MSPYFARQPVTVWLFVVTGVGWVLLELRQALRRRSGVVMRDRGSHLVLTLAIGAGWLVTAFAVTRLPKAAIPGQPIAFIAGLVLAWAGIGLRGWAFHTLGQYFTFWVQTSPDQPVIATGPYRLLRHPSYTGIELILLGLSLFYGNWVGVAAMAILPMLGLGNRIRVEEKALETDLGSAYRDFESTRKRMIPYIW